MEKIIGSLPLTKIAAPVVPVLVIDIFLGKFIENIYTINVNNNIQNQFPTSKTFLAFLGINLFVIVVYLLLSVYSHICKERLDSLRLGKRHK